MIYAVASMSALGLGLGLLLGAAARKFHVETPPIVDEIETLLPGTNCGQCGYAGCRGAAEAIEAIAHGDKQSSKVVGRTIRDIALPDGTTIGAIVRGKEVIIAHGDVMVESGDHVILFVIDKRRIRDVERLFQVGLTFF